MTDSAGMISLPADEKALQDLPAKVRSWLDHTCRLVVPLSCIEESCSMKRRLCSSSRDLPALACRPNTSGASSRGKFLMNSLQPHGCQRCMCSVWQTATCCLQRCMCPPLQLSVMLHLHTVAAVFDAQRFVANLLQGCQNMKPSHAWN